MEGPNLAPFETKAIPYRFGKLKVTASSRGLPPHQSVAQAEQLVRVRFLERLAE